MMKCILNTNKSWEDIDTLVNSGLQHMGEAIASGE